jgi:hypothetical protein
LFRDVYVYLYRQLYWRLLVWVYWVLGMLG